MAEISTVHQVLIDKSCGIEIFVSSEYEIYMDHLYLVNPMQTRGKLSWECWFLEMTIISVTAGHFMQI